MRSTMQNNQWVQSFAAAITVCDVNGIILEMNDESAKVFEEFGGASMIGKNLFNCHSSASQEKLKKMIADQQENVYTVGKHGKKKLIYQHPWYENGVYGGFVEISLPLPEEIPHFDRD